MDPVVCLGCRCCRPTTLHHPSDWRQRQQPTQSTYLVCVNTQQHIRKYGHTRPSPRSAEQTHSGHVISFSLSSLQLQSNWHSALRELWQAVRQAADGNWGDLWLRCGMRARPESVFVDEHVWLCVGFWMDCFLSLWSLQPACSLPLLSLLFTFFPQQLLESRLFSFSLFFFFSFLF